MKLAPIEERLKMDKIVLTQRELWQAQAPSWNFELDVEQLLDKALELGYVTKVGDDLYEINNDYRGKNDRVAT